MQTFWTLLAESTIVQGLLTLGLWILVGIMAYQGKPLPEILIWGSSATLGFWFGTKSQRVKLNHQG